MVFKKPRKIRLTPDEEFQLFKIVLDKYLWLGTIGIMVGIYCLFRKDIDPGFGLMLTLVGAIILLSFTAVLARHFDFKRTK
jgi:drug/metabolite transporter (DMT)-like permease